MAIKLLDESIVNEDKGSYVVKRVIFDVAFKDEDHAKSFNYGGGAGNHEVSNAIADAFEKSGYELAGDIIETTEDLTNIYRGEDYYDFYGIKDYIVKRVEVDVAARDEEHAKGLNDGHGAPSQFGGNIINNLDDALESCGYEMAGDLMSVEDDFTDVYMDNDYEFFISESSAMTEDDDDYPLSTRSGTKFRKRNQSGLEGIIDINFPSFTVKYEVGDGLQFKNPKGLESNDDAVLKLVNGEDDRVAKIIKNAVIDAMKEKGFSAEAPHSVLIGLPATVRITKGVTESVESDEYKSYRDQWEKDYKDKNRSQKEIDDFITSAWNELNHGENRFTGDEFKKLCADAGVDHKKFMESINVGDKYDEYCTDCDTITTQKFKGNFKDGDKTIGRYVCCRCGCENDGDPSDEVVKESVNLPEEVREIVYDACKDAYENGNLDEDLLRYIYEDLEGLEYDKKEVEKYFYELLNDRSFTEGYDMANPKDAEDINLDLVASLSVKTYEAVEALQRPRFRMKLRELVGGFGAELHECSVDETNPLED